jgi:hypothetical protein
MSYRPADLAGEGPELDPLVKRLMETGREWLELSGTRAGDGGGRLAALAADVLASLGGSYPEVAWLETFGKARNGEHGASREKRLKVASLALRVFSDPCFSGKGALAGKVKKFLESEVLAELAGCVEAESFVVDGDRREELARLCLAALGLRPKGESPEAAADRLSAVDSRERLRLVELSRQAQERAQALREAMRRAEAEEAASKMSRE